MYSLSVECVNMGGKVALQTGCMWLTDRTGLYRVTSSVFHTLIKLHNNAV